MKSLYYNGCFTKKITMLLPMFIDDCIWQTTFNIVLFVIITLSLPNRYRKCWQVYTVQPSARVRLLQIQGLVSPGQGHHLPLARHHPEPVALSHLVVIKGSRGTENREVEGRSREREAGSIGDGERWCTYEKV